MPKPPPTTHQFTKYQKLYEYYNKTLFSDKPLPFCLLNLSRNTPCICGHFSMNRWEDGEGNKTHEININPVYAAKASNEEICQTLVHEMVHLWQFEFGKQRSRMGYHNREWGAKMESVGLMPSHTGKPGGRKTGQQMNDYTIKGGAFEKAFKKMPKSILLPFKSKESEGMYLGDGLGLGFLGDLFTDTPEPSGSRPSPTRPRPQPIFKPYRKNKAKYTCPCGNNVWGKPSMDLICGECRGEFAEVA